MSPEVLVVVTSHAEIEGRPLTGVWFEEYAIPFRELVASGAGVTVASPRGGVAPVDPRSLSAEVRAAYPEAWARLQDTRVLSRVRADDFDAVFFPGGHGPMFDLATDADVKALVAAFTDAGKVVGAVCHGPAALIGVVLRDGRSLVHGRTLTSFTAVEEERGALGPYMPFDLQAALTAEGARFVDGGPHAAHVEVDGLLVTGQNPESSAVTARAFLDAVTSATGPRPAERLADGVYFLEGDPARWWCNHGWVELDEFVLVIDASMPTGAERALPVIRRTTTRPVRLVLDTHAHPDHSYANAVWLANGVLPVATRGVVEDLRAGEPGQLGGGGTGLWEQVAPLFPELAGTRLVAPAVQLGDGAVFDDGTRRVEIVSLGPAHTRSDTVAWLPRERILFAADLVAGGPNNTFGEADIDGWIAALDRVAAWEPAVVVPGHGRRGGPELIAGQRAYLRALRREAADGADVADVRARLSADPEVALWVPPDDPALVDRLTLAGHLTAVRAQLAGVR